MVKRKKGKIALLIAIVVTIMLIYMNSPIVVGDWTKQTVYLWTLNSCHIQATGTQPKMHLIDDDSGDGVFIIKKLSDDLHIKATFAVIPTQTSKNVLDSLHNWQKEGYNIALHGYNHDDWREWNHKDIMIDITKSEQWLIRHGLRIDEMKYIVAPHGSNTQAVRKAIKDKGYQMVTSANIVNPNTEVFQLGRVMITKDTDLEKTKIWLNKAKERNLFVILGTHSSMPEEFSEEKIKAVLQMAINMGFEYQH